jgi:hypothetical protein
MAYVGKNKIARKKVANAMPPAPAVKRSRAKEPSAWRVETKGAPKARVKEKREAKGNRNQDSSCLAGAKERRPAQKCQVGVPILTAERSLSQTLVIHRTL